MEHEIGQAGKLPMTALMLVLPPGKAGIELLPALLDVLTIDPRLDGLLLKLQEEPFAAILDRWKPFRFQRDWGALDIGFVLSVDIGGDSFEASKSEQRQDFAQPVKLDNRLDAVGATGSPPDAVWKPSSVKAWIDGNIITKTLGCSDQCLQLDLLYGLIAPFAALGLTDGLENLRLGEGSKLLCNLGLPLKEL